MKASVVVVGAGLAGAAAALTLSHHREVLVIDAEGPAAGASGAAAGIINPFMGRKAKPAWNMDDALAALDALLDEADATALFIRTGVLRPAHSDRQRAAFEDRAAEHPAALSWLRPQVAAERYPAAAAPLGALFVPSGGHIDLGALVRALLAAAERRGAARRDGWRLRSWRHEGDGLVAITDHSEIRCRHLLLALGDGAHAIPSLAPLPLHRVKGQTLRLARPAELPPDLPAIAGHGYVVPSAEGVVVGATFEHDFDDVAPDPGKDAVLVAQAARLVPSLAGADVRERRAGVRITVPTAVSPRRLPLAGPLPGHHGVWILTGLGSKGLLTAPLLARRFPAVIDGHQPFPSEIDTRSVLGSV